MNLFCTVLSTTAVILTCATVAEGTIHKWNNQPQVLLGNSADHVAPAHADSDSQSVLLSHLISSFEAVTPPQRVKTAQRLEGLSVPEYALQYAPLVYLHAEETYFPSDLSTFLTHVLPLLNYTSILTPPAPSPPRLSNLDSLNSVDVDPQGNGTFVYLSSIDDFTTNPSWLGGVKPNSDGKTEGAVSCVVIVRAWDDASGTVDVFYMYFYAWNRGDIVLGQELGDHLGDWEHNMIRFVNGTPAYVWYSEHEFGEAFTYEAVPKGGNRVVAYSANGTHANWATVGSHDHTIPDVSDPWGLVQDFTSNGTLWDPLLNAYFYSVSFPNTSSSATSASNPPYQITNNTSPPPTIGPIFSPLPNPFSPPNSTNSTIPPTAYLSFTGQWGNKQLPRSDPRQVDFLDLGKFFKYESGPTGPRDKDLSRTLVCQGTSYPCLIRSSVEGGD